MHFSFEQLSTFVIVYEQGSFSKAAIHLSKHRSTVSQVIINLESTLNVQLFERSGRTVTQTKESNLLYRYAKQAVEQTKAFDKLALNLSTGSLEEISIGYCSFLPQLAIVDIRMQLARDFPGLRVNLYVMNKQAIKKGLESGKLHFGLVNVHESSGISSINTIFLDTLELVPFARKGGEIANTPKKNMLIKLKHSKQLILQSLIDEGMSNKVTISADFEAIDQLSVMVKLLELGHGWAFLPQSVIKSEYVKQNLVPIKIQQLKKGLEIPISLWSDHSQNTAKVRSSIILAIEGYIDHILDELGMI